LGRIYDSVHITHPRIRQFAVAWIYLPAETDTDLEDRLVDVPPEERELPDFSTPWPWDVDCMALALFVIELNREETERGMKSK
jgi:hypothetical protein